MCSSGRHIHPSLFCYATPLRHRKFAFQKNFAIGRSAISASFSKKFKHGDPMPPLKVLREKHQEAMDIACHLRWDTCATPLIEVLMSRDSLYTVRLEPWLELPSDPDDAVVELGDLLSIIHTTTEHLESKHKVLDSGNAK